ncbi:hypothetical protein AAF712_008197 [Marasmius tenuissimus]|uniref:Carbohydrate esterase family 16 protein n=1 Tax=Marasmius tenuissimus TaxID=585030 RepID=A0ABR2ZT12_9AGAR
MLSFLSFTLLALSFQLVYTDKSTPAKPNAFDLDSIKYFYAFGDSYTFVQGTAGHANFSFIGDALEPDFTPAELTTNNIIPRNTSSEGSNWVEFLSGCFQGLPSECKTQLWDFAFAGADVDAALLPRHHDYTLQLVEQVDQWIQYASDVIPHPDNETLTAWWIGINDTGDSFGNSSIPDFRAFWEKEMASYFNAVQLAYNAGLTTHLFLNVPPGERSPSWVGRPDAPQVRSHINLFNEVMDEYRDRFAKQNPGATVMFFDANAWFNSVLDDPARFGFTNVTGSNTSPDPQGFFWYNAGHPTEAVHRLLAEAIRAQLQGDDL